MTSLRPGTLTLACAGALVAAPSNAAIRGSIGAEGRGFLEAPQFPDQSTQHLQPSLSLSFEASASTASVDYDLDAFARVADDSSRPSGDVRQASATRRTDRSEWRLGVLTESWGVLEAWNPSDIFNQRDLAEDFQGTAKLGQPGMAATWQFDKVELSALASTWARGRRFAYGRDRLRLLPLPIVEETFEHGRWAPDVFVRARLPMGEGSVAISHFAGHSREPQLRAVFGPRGPVGLQANYRRIEQTAMEAQYVLGDSVLKAELIHRVDDADAFWGGGIGVETRVSKPAGGNGELSLYAEFYLDGRDARAPATPFQHDAFLGVRHAFNDARDTIVELRTTHDLDWHSHLVDARVAWRAGNGMVSASLLRPIHAQRDPALSGLSRDANLRIAWTRYF